MLQEANLKQPWWQKTRLGIGEWRRNLLLLSEALRKSAGSYICYMSQGYVHLGSQILQLADVDRLSLRFMEFNNVIQVMTIIAHFAAFAYHFARSRPKTKLTINELKMQQSLIVCQVYKSTTTESVCTCMPLSGTSPCVLCQLDWLHMPAVNMHMTFHKLARGPSQRR